MKKKLYSIKARGKLIVLPALFTVAIQNDY